MSPPATLPPASNVSAHARRVFADAERRPLFLADWARAVFIHYAVAPESLQPCVPFSLDLYHGCAYVTLVAFTMERMRPALLDSRAGELLLRPLSPCRFLNVRTYVREAGMTGIYFLAEWLSSRWSVPLGPIAFGLPYRLGELEYRAPRDDGLIRGQVTSTAGGVLSYNGEPAREAKPAAARSGSLDEFLLERYVAFTEHAGRRRFFRVWHHPWPQVPFELELNRATLLAETGSWCKDARLDGAHCSEGAANVWMGRPHRLG